MMSGGVDSSVAAAVLRDEGHDVTGVTLKLWGGESDSGCCRVADVEDARRVAAQLDIPHYVFNFTDEFDDQVVAPYVDELRRGPHAEPVRRVQPHDEVRPAARAARRDRLRRGRDRSPRRPHRRATTARAELAAAPIPPRTSRTCSTCSGADAARATLLPVGEMTKADVRAHAARLGLRTADQAREHGRVLHHARRAHRVPRRRASPPAPGAIVDGAGADVGDARRRATRSRSASGAAPVSPSASGATSSTSTRRPRPSRSAGRGARRDRVDFAHVTLHRRAARRRTARRRRRCARTARRGRGRWRRRRRACATSRSRASRPARSSRSTTATCCSAAASPR